MTRRVDPRAFRHAFVIAAVCQFALLSGCSDRDTRRYGPSCFLDELETFDSAIPAGWTVVNNGSGADAWTWFQGSLLWDIPPLQANGGAIVDSRTGGYGEADDADIETPLYEIGGCDGATVSFRFLYKDNPEDEQDVGEVYVIPGGIDAPVLVRTFAASSPAGALMWYSFPVTESMLGERNSFSVLFHYEGWYDWGWYIDDVSVTGML